MKLKNMWKRFWTLDVHNHEGFTLVELIIVIAILAILSTGAIAGYSAYVEKANITADKAMIAEIENVLLLHYYDNGGSGAGYVVIYPDDEAEASSSLVEALRAAYGEHWNKALKLKYTGWEDDGMLRALLQSDVANIAASPFIQDASTEELLGTVTTLTQAATEAFVNVGGTESQLQAMMGKDFTDKLAAEGITKENPDYNTIVSNMMVTHIANEFTGNHDDASMGTQLALQYAMMYSYALTNEAAMEEMREINNKLAKATSTQELFDSLIFSDAFSEGYGAYMDKNEEKNVNAFVDIMKTVDSISGQLTDYSDPTMYISEHVTDLLQNYTTAVTTVAALGLSNTEKDIISAAVQDGALVVLLSNDGIVATFPSSVNSAN